MMSTQEYNHTLNNSDTSWDTTHHVCTLELNRNALRIALFLLYLFIFIAGLLGNLLVLWVNWHRRRSSNGVLFCIINISLSDIMVIVTLPFFMMEVTIERVWLWGGFLCKVTNLIFAVNFYSSSFFLALMTLERYLSLTKPNFSTLFPGVGKRRWWLCGGIWLFSLFLALFENVHVKLLEGDEPGCVMLPEHNHMEWFTSLVFLKFIFQFLIPSAAIITCNVLISRAVRAAPDVQNPRDVWLINIYSVVFVLCLLPYHLVRLTLITRALTGYIFSCNVGHMFFFMYEIVKVLFLVHCVANPILYNFLSKSFRHKLINTVMTYISKDGNAVQMEAGTQPDGGERKMSNASTSQSDMGL